MEIGKMNNGYTSGYTRDNVQSVLDNNDYVGEEKICISTNENKQFHEKYSDKDIKEAGDIIDKILKQQDFKLEYKTHDKFKYITMIKIVDSKTGDTIKEIPPKKILDMVAAMCEMVGLMVDEKA